MNNLNPNQVNGYRLAMLTREIINLKDLVRLQNKTLQDKQVICDYYKEMLLYYHELLADTGSETPPAWQCPQPVLDESVDPRILYKDYRQKPPFPQP